MVNIEVPAKLSGKEKKAMEKLISSLHENHFEETIKLQKETKKFYERKRKLDTE